MKSSPLKSLSISGGAFAYRILRRVVRLLPMPLAVRIGAGFGGLIGRFFKRELRIASAQLQLVAARNKLSGSLSQSTIQSIPLKVFRHVGESVVELMVADKLFELNPGPNPSHPWMPNFKYFTFTGPDSVRQMLEEKAPSLALTAHLGCFELLAPFYVRVGFSVSVMRRRPNYPELDELHRTFLEWSGADVLWREDTSSGRKLIRQLREGSRVVAALIDQDTDLESEYTPFFGVDAASPIAPVQLAIKYKLPIYATFIVRTASLQHQVVIEKLDYNPEDPQVIKNIVAEYNSRLQALICQYPEQWLWWHRRWRHRPEVNYSENPEALMGTSAYLEWLEKIESR